MIFQLEGFQAICKQEGFAAICRWKGFAFGTMEVGGIWDLMPAEGLCSGRDWQQYASRKDLLAAIWQREGFAAG